MVVGYLKWNQGIMEGTEGKAEEGGRELVTSDFGISSFFFFGLFAF